MGTQVRYPDAHAVPQSCTFHHVDKLKYYSGGAIVLTSQTPVALLRHSLLELPPYYLSALWPESISIEPREEADMRLPTWRSLERSVGSSATSVASPLVQLNMF